MTNIRQWLQAHADLPRLECELLVADLLNLSRTQILTHPDRLLAAAELQQLDTNAQQLRQGVPFAYVVGHRAFWELDFKVNSDVLIPRPETELLVEWAIANTPPNGKLLDLGTGSGAIAVSIAFARPDVAVSATDVSCAALDVARENAKNNRTNVQLINSNWFEQISGEWDVIVSNPPYIAEGDPHLPDLWAEPHTALVSSANGLLDLAHIIEQSQAHLKPGGWLALEHGYNQAHQVRQLLRQASFDEVESHKDLAHIERISVGRA